MLRWLFSHPRKIILYGGKQRIPIQETGLTLTHLSVLRQKWWWITCNISLGSVQFICLHSIIPQPLSHFKWWLFGKRGIPYLLQETEAYFMKRNQISRDRNIFYEKKSQSTIHGNIWDPMRYDVKGSGLCSTLKSWGRLNGTGSPFSV